jgi:poly-D-alanine transfer protein DltD
VRSAGALRAQYDAVYPEIKRQLEAAGIEYADLTRMFDGEEFLYIDFAHVSHRGNDIAARQISALLR